MKTDIIKYLQMAVEKGASDIFIISGLQVSMKRNGEIIGTGDEVVMPQLGNQLVASLYELAARSTERFHKTGDDDFSVSVKGLSRFRVSTYMQRGSMAAVIRVVNFDIPDYRDLRIPEEVMSVVNVSKGMILVTGPAGGGKSTTLACLTNAINETRNAHIITIEDPIEYLHKNISSVVSQREIGTDTESYVTALRACLRQAPDVIVVGEMRDLETIRIAMTAAETGHLVISTLHTVGAVNTIDRIIDVFPPGQQQQIRIQLAMVLRSVVSQQLLPGETGGRVPAFEIMHLNNAIRNMIRESKIHQIDSVISSASSERMVSMDASLLRLYEEGQISRENAIKYASNSERIARRIDIVREM